MMNNELNHISPFPGYVGRKNSHARMFEKHNQKIRRRKRNKLARKSRRINKMK